MFENRNVCKNRLNGREEEAAPISMGSRGKESINVLPP